MDFLDRVKEYLETELSLPYPIIVGVLGAESPSIAIRQTPSAVIDRYVDRGKTFEFSFQVLMKDKGRKQVNVIDTMSRIFDLLDGLPSGSIVSNDGSFNFVTCECSTLPNFVEKTEHNEYIYTSIYTAELEKTWKVKASEDKWFWLTPYQIMKYPAQWDKRRSINGF